MKVENQWRYPTTDTNKWVNISLRKKAVWGKLSQVNYVKQIKPRHVLAPLWKL